MIATQMKRIKAEVVKGFYTLAVSAHIIKVLLKKICGHLHKSVSSVFPSTAVRNQTLTVRYRTPFLILLCEILYR
jgi:hypothetical protein